MRMRTVLSLILSVFMIQATALADTLFVPSQYSSIQEAVNAASNGDDIIVDAGTYWESINTNGTSVNIIGQSNSTSPGDPGTIIYGNFGSVITIDADCSLSNLILRNGYANRGGGLNVNANASAVQVTMDTCWIEECYGYQGGGGIYFDGGQTGGTLTMMDCRITRCVSENGPMEYEKGGGIAFYNGTLSMTNCLLSRNQAADGSDFGEGGGLYTENALVAVQACTFTANTGFAWYNGPNCASLMSDSNLGCNQPSNSVIGESGLPSGKNNDFDYTCPIYVSQDGSGDYFSIQDAIWNASGGEEIIISGDTYYESLYIPEYLDDLIFTGSLNANGTLTTLVGDWGSDSLVRSMTSVTFRDMVFDRSGSTAFAEGGVFHSSNMNGTNEITVEFNGCEFLNNQSGGYNGGVIYQIGGSLTLNSCMFHNNTDAWFGGAVFIANANGTDASSTLAVNACSFDGNTANTAGGIYLGFGVKAEINDSYFSCNKPGDIAGGGSWTGDGNSFETCVLTVTQDGTGDYWNIQDAINDAADGYIIEVSAETYYESIFIYGKDITIEGTIAFNRNATDRTTIDGLFNGGPVVESGRNVTLRNLRLVNGSSGVGGGFAEYFFGDTHVVMENVWIENCVASENGGGIYKNGGSLSLIDCRLVNNNATWGNGGGLYNQNATVTIENTEIKRNGGGGWYNGDGSVSTLTNSTITCNRPYQVNTNGTGVWTDLGGNDVGACVYTVCADGGCDFTTIQDAVDYAQDGEIIEVWPGTYRADPWDSISDPVVDMMGKAITLRSRDGAEVTIIDGDDERCGILCNSNENASTTSTIIQGFTIRDCSSMGSDTGSGAGIRCESSSPTIESCVFMENVNEYNDIFGGGAAIALVNCNASILNCDFMANASQAYGGAISSNYSMNVFSGCVFEGNAVGVEMFGYGGGAAVICYESMDTFDSCIFKNNSGPQVEQNGSPDMPIESGGAVLAVWSDPYFIDCIFSNNECDAYSGTGFSFADFVNCEFSGNEGCGIINNLSSSYVQDSTFCENEDDICGAWVDFGGNEFLDTCLPPFTCSGDTNLDYNVDVLDILYILATWGTSNPAGDIDGNGLVDVNDVLTVVGNWGPCDD